MDAGVQEVKGSASVLVKNIKLYNLIVIIVRRTFQLHSTDMTNKLYKAMTDNDLIPTINTNVIWPVF